jgi:hypothetical protein
MILVRQGDVLFLEKNSMHVLVLSRDFFNRSGIAATGPVLSPGQESLLRID